MTEQRIVLMCPNAACERAGALAEVRVWPEASAPLRCPACEEAVVFVNAEACEHLST